MAIIVRKVTATLNGSGAGTADTDDLNGYLLTVSLDYESTAGTTDVTVALVDPALTYLTISNSNTDAVKHPRASTVTTANAAITDGSGLLPVRGVIRLTVADGTAAGTVSATYFLEV